MLVIKDLPSSNRPDSLEVGFLSLPYVLYGRLALHFWYLIHIPLSPKIYRSGMFTMNHRGKLSLLTGYNDYHNQRWFQRFMMPNGYLVNSEKLSFLEKQNPNFKYPFLGFLAFSQWISLTFIFCRVDDIEEWVS